MWDDAMVDEAAKASFPASDPPGWTLGLERAGLEAGHGGPVEAISKGDETDAASSSVWSAAKVLKTLLAAAALASIAYLLTRHTNHAIGYLPYLIILACPAMHVFMHRGHRHP